MGTSKTNSNGNQFLQEILPRKKVFWQEKKYPLDSTALLLVNVSVHDVVMETTLFASKG